MKPLFSIARPMSALEQGTHSNPKCVYFRVRNDGTIGARLSPVI